MKNICKASNWTGPKVNRRNFCLKSTLFLGYLRSLICDSSCTVAVKVFGPTCLRRVKLRFKTSRFKIGNFCVAIKNRTRTRASADKVCFAGSRILCSLMNVNKLRPTGADVEDDVKCYKIVHPPDRLPDRQSDRLPSVSSSDHLAEESKRVFF